MLEPQEWALLSRYVNKISLSTKLHYFQYRLMNKKIVTNIHRSKWDKNLPPKCYFCQKNNETTLHLFYECKVVNKLWLNLQRWCKSILQLSLCFVVVVSSFQSMNAFSETGYPAFYR